MSELPSSELLLQTLATNWNVSPESVRQCPKSGRLWHVEGRGFARVGFARGGLSAGQLVELVDSLHAAGCAVPDIVETQSGHLFVELGETSLSIERELPGSECSAERLDILSGLGRELGRLHEVMYRFPVAPGQNRSLRTWVEQKLALAQAAAEDPRHLEAVHKLALALPTNLNEKEVRWGLTHGDIRGPNVLCDGMVLGFVDFNLTYEPQLTDLVMIQNKWLMNGDVAHERPLTNHEVSSVLRGYHVSRPFTSEEVDAFPVIWAVYLAWRLFQDLRIVNRFDEDRQARWPIESQILNLPGELEIAHDILRESIGV